MYIKKEFSLYLKDIMNNFNFMAYDDAISLIMNLIKKDFNESQKK